MPNYPMTLSFRLYTGSPTCRESLQAENMLQDANLRLMLLGNYLESQWLIIMGYFKPIMVNFGLWWPVVSSYLAVQVLLAGLVTLLVTDVRPLWTTVSRDLSPVIGRCHDS